MEYVFNYKLIKKKQISYNFKILIFISMFWSGKYAYINKFFLKYLTTIFY